MPISPYSFHHLQIAKHAVAIVSMSDEFIARCETRPRNRVIAAFQSRFARFLKVMEREVDRSICNSQTDTTTQGMYEKMPACIR
jgi:hypothetical protein